jgi:protein-S-isoprenylcysteine O-methyltransferase Ste14
MTEPTPPTRKQRLTAIDGALALIALLLIVQMWLLTATLEAYLAGHHDVALPAAILSGALLLVCAALYLFVRRVDATGREPHQEPVQAPREPRG